MKTKANTSDAALTRRQFLRGTALTTAAFMVVPGAVLGLRGAASPAGVLPNASAHVKVGRAVPARRANPRNPARFGYIIPNPEVELSHSAKYQFHMYLLARSSTSAEWDFHALSPSY